MKTFLSLIVLNSTVGCYGLTAENVGEPAAKKQKTGATTEEMIAQLRNEFNASLSQQKQEFEFKLAEQKKKINKLRKHKKRSDAKIAKLEDYTFHIIRSFSGESECPFDTEFVKSNPIFEHALYSQGSVDGDALVSNFAEQTTCGFWIRYCASNLNALFYAMFFHKDPQVALMLLDKIHSFYLNKAFENHDHVRHWWGLILEWVCNIDFEPGDFTQESCCNVDVWRAFLEKINAEHLGLPSTCHEFTVLHVFAINGVAPIVQLLLDCMRPGDIIANDYPALGTAFHCAFTSSSVSEVFASHPKIEAEDFVTGSKCHRGPAGSTPLMSALENDNLAAATVLLKWQVRKHPSFQSFLMFRSSCKFIRHALSPDKNLAPTEDLCSGTLSKFEGKPELLRKVGNLLWRDPSRRFLKDVLASTKNNDGESVLAVLQRKRNDERFVKAHSAADINAFENMLQNPIEFIQ